MMELQGRYFTNGYRRSGVGNSSPMVELQGRDFTNG
jgi:hypothetical protein